MYYGMYYRRFLLIQIALQTFLLIQMFFLALQTILALQMILLIQMFFFSIIQKVKLNKIVKHIF
jgi:hypothetical protein